MVTPIFLMATGAPSPVAPFSHAVEADGWIYVTGQMPNVAGKEDAPLPEGIEGQTRIYLTHFKEDYTAMNAIYESYFEPGRLPARTCVGVTALALDARIEIDLLARRPDE